MRFIYTQEQLAFIESEYQKGSYNHVAAAFNAKYATDKTASQIRCTISNHKIKCGRKTGSINKGNYKLFTEQQAQFIKEGYQQYSIETLTGLLNNAFNTCFDASQIRSFTRNHAIKSGRTGYFENGRIPFNAGTKGIMKPNETSFKKGQRPHNATPVGSYRVTSEGYPQYKLAEPGLWVNESALVWIANNGEYPDDMKIYHCDGNRLNTDIDNLVLVDSTEALYLTQMGFKSLPADFKESALLIARLSGKTASIMRSFGVPAAKLGASCQKAL